MTYLEAIAPYRDAYGLVTPTKPANLTDNQFLFHATHISIMRRLRLSPVSYEVEIFTEYYLDRLAASQGCVPLPQKSWSHPNLSHDDVNGIASVLPFTMRPLFWSFNATGSFLDYFRGWYGRCLYLVPFIKVMNGKTPTWLEQQLYRFHCWRVSRLPWGNAGAKCLLALQAVHQDQFPPVMKKAMRDFCSAMNTMYGDLGGLYAVYFSPEDPQNPTHPFAVFTKGVKL